MTTDTALTQPVAIAQRGSDEASERDGPTGKAAFWDALLRAGVDVDKLARKAVAALPSDAAAALTALHEDLRARLEYLRAELAGIPDHERIMLVLVFYYDERVMRQLPDSARLRFVPLQSEWIGSSHGGTEFYRVLDKMVQDEATPSHVFEVFYFCLHNGFVGRYAGNPDAIDAYKRYLESRIETPDIAEPLPSSPQSRTPLPAQWHPAWYYVITGLCVIALMVTVTMLTNC